MNASSMGYPGQRGLYSPAFEHDACGIGMIVDIAGRRSHKIVTQALDILCNLEHRGGAGAEPDTGDGAGILTQLPHAFLERECHLMGITLPAPGRYGVGMLFLSREESRRTAAEAAFEAIVREQGQRFLGWRSVPVNATTLGKTSRACMPVIRQAFIERSADIDDEEAFERKLARSPKSVCATRRMPGRGTFTPPACPVAPSFTRACCSAVRSPSCIWI